MNNVTTTVLLAFVIGCGGGWLLMNQPSPEIADVESESTPADAPPPSDSEAVEPPPAPAEPTITQQELSALFLSGTNKYRHRRWAAALTDLEIVVKYCEHDRATSHMYGACLLQLKRFPLAVAHFEKMVASKPDDPHALFRLGWAYEKTNRYDEAIARYEESLRIYPKQPMTANNLAWVLATAPDESLRNGSEAIRLCQVARQLHGEQTSWLADTLAAAHAETGNFTEAVRLQTYSEAAAPKQMQPELRARLQLYRQGKPFRLPR